MVCVCCLFGYTSDPGWIDCCSYLVSCVWWCVDVVVVVVVVVIVVVVDVDVDVVVDGVVCVSCSGLVVN